MSEVIKQNQPLVTNEQAFYLDKHGEVQRATPPQENTFGQEANAALEAGADSKFKDHPIISKNPAFSSMDPKQNPTPPENPSAQQPNELQHQLTMAAKHEYVPKHQPAPSAAPTLTR